MQPAGSECTGAGSECTGTGRCCEGVATSILDATMRLVAALLAPLLLPLAPRGAVRLGAPRLAGPPAEDTSSGIQVSLRDPETDRSLCRVKVSQLATPAGLDARPFCWLPCGPERRASPRRCRREADGALVPCPSCPPEVSTNPTGRWSVTSCRRRRRRARCTRR